MLGLRDVEVGDVEEILIFFRYTVPFITLRCKLVSVVN